MTAEGVFREIVDRFYRISRDLADLPVGEDVRGRRAFMLGQLDSAQHDGDLLADVLGVARPDWEHLYEVVR